MESILMKKRVVAAVVVFIVMMMAVGGQNCGSNLSSVQMCAPLVLPGAVNATPDSQCCAALQSTPNDCLCNALRAAAALPSLCNLPPVNCGITA